MKVADKKKQDIYSLSPFTKRTLVLIMVLKELLSMKYLNDEYQDRGMKKWAGFFLSEHTAEQEKIQKGLAHINSPKPQMSEQEIGEVLQVARLKNKSVAIQIEAIDNEGNYYD